MRKLLIGVLALAILGADSPKIRGRIQEYERARYALVVYKKNRASQGRQAAVDAGFSVSRHEPKLNAYRVRWSGNDRKALEEKLGRLAENPDIQLIEPDPRH